MLHDEVLDQNQIDDVVPFWLDFILVHQWFASDESKASNKDHKAKVGKCLNEKLF